ncbi:malonyl-ACP O-methyltransferase BioC [Rodentibacter caecimuris]|uniref:Malonyl-[acyl-carrier protein] O-methyltransferase n=1 Tax=Rodentibacter caecimuris TaxID=1796644 RepID=A0ABX3L1L5_9PAST|nr:malonyl-[acyl-carrier protein] O-methyltransferase BioC [Rodentibacter heylii]
MDLTSKALVKRYFSRAIPFYDEQAKAQQEINRRLMNLLLSTRTNFDHVLEIGCGTGDFSHLLQRHIRAKKWLFNDLCDVSAQLKQKLSRPYQFICGDAEQIDFQGKFDLISSASAVQWFHRPQQFIQRLRRLFAPNGLLLLSTFTPDNLSEIRHLTQIGLDYPDIKIWQNWLAADFELYHLESGKIELFFEHPIDVLKHLKLSGVTAIKKSSWTTTTVKTFCKHYQAQYTFSEGVKLTYTPLFILAGYRGAKWDV